MNIEVDAQRVIDNLLEQNKQLTLEVAILRAQVSKDEVAQEQEEQS